MPDVLKSLRHNIGRVQAELETKRRSPDELLGELLMAVQTSRLYTDSMAFVDMVPTRQLNRILKAYKVHRHDPDFNLAKFVEKYFTLPKMDVSYTTNPEHSIEEHVDELWSVLEREQHRSKGSLIGLPHPYIVAGGRFRSMYYWDSYFIMLGLAVAGKWSMVESMLKNCAFMLRKYGHIPNGNRTYYIGRSQPPFFAAMVRLMANQKGKRLLVYYLPYLLVEHHFWIKGSGKLHDGGASLRRAVRMPGGEILNRYYDDKSSPRPEGYREDLSMVLASGDHVPGEMHRNLRAAAESGWDFSSRWLKDPYLLASVHTTDIVPVDLNCLLTQLEHTIADAYALLRSPKTSARYRALAEHRAMAINRYCWDDQKGYYFDYDVVTNKREEVISAAGIFPLYAGIASHEQASQVAELIGKTLLQSGGLLTTNISTGQQWDAPNGWAPLQWIAVQGLRNYGYNELADEIKKRWLKTVTAVYHAKGKMVEKYNVTTPSHAAGGGEYPLQDGFGWTNGVLMALLHEDELKWK